MKRKNKKCPIWTGSFWDNNIFLIGTVSFREKIVSFREKKRSQYEKRRKTVKKKLLLIDGNSIMNRAFYGIMGSKMLMTTDGKYTNAMFTMLRTLLGIYKKVKPEYVAFVFDKTRDTFRRT